jgi:hypothetical protein
MRIGQSDASMVSLFDTETLAAVCQSRRQMSIGTGSTGNREPSTPTDSTNVLNSNTLLNKEEEEEEKEEEVSLLIVAVLFKEGCGSCAPTCIGSTAMAAR